MSSYENAEVKRPANYQQKLERLTEMAQQERGEEMLETVSDDLQMLVDDRANADPDIKDMYIGWKQKDIEDLRSAVIELLSKKQQGK